MNHFVLFTLDNLHKKRVALTDEIDSPGKGNLRNRNTRIL